MKALFLEDGFFTRETVAAPECQRKLAEIPGITYDFAKDTNRDRFSKLTEFTYKLETEGPEGWIQIDPEVREKLPETEILFAHASGVTREMMELAPKLKLIYLMRSGTENVNLQAAAELGIKVCNCPSRLKEPVADITVALMINECRGLGRGNLQYTKGQWVHLDKMDRNCAALCNLTIGLMGYGGIARAVAKRLVQGFGAYVIAYDPFMPESVMREDGVVPVSRETLLRESDIVSLHIKLTPETVGLIGDAEFEMMKDTAVFVNTARADIVQEQALIAALKEKKIRGAALDVYWQEPIPRDHPLLTMDNVTLTPHRAGMTSDVVPNTLNIVAEELKRYVSGEPLRFEVKIK